ncbi:hypothetical protein [uncultured Lamprocystis sp.]|jgi:hypothetical protein|uniref:hypothetical protein n=1 Tax=uncultured Lamprocystis sp. TaxID=543132 RepID=UPI0025ED60E7|nr:hypothetical protein [uncultured Lamprocystis sp.]
MKTGHDRPADPAPDTPPTAPDFTAWDMLDSFTIAEAASLWLNVEPLDNDVLIGPYKRQALARALADKLGLTDGHCGPDKMVDRNALRSLAIESNKRPPFLFPEDRQGDSAEEDAQGKSLGKRERTTFLIIVAALCDIANFDLSQGHKVAGAIANQTSLNGVPIDSGGIAEKLKEIPKAIESKKKQIDGLSGLGRAANHRN